MSRIGRRRARPTLALAILVLAGCSVGSTPAGSPGTVSRTPTETAVDRLEVACDGSTTVVARRTVAAGSAGVRAHVTGAGAGRGLYLAYGYARSGEDVQPAGGDPVPADGLVTVVLPPGQGGVACQGDGENPTQLVPVTVVDPNGLYLERRPLAQDLDCDHPGQASSAFVGRGATAAEAASDFARRVDAALGARGSGYADQNPQEFLVVRSGKAIGTTQAFRSDDGWEAAWNLVCT